MSSQRVYSWTTHEDEVAEDAIIVGIGGTSAEMLIAGFSYVEPTASIYWCERVTSAGVFSAGSEAGTWDVPSALVRAEELCRQMGYERVVIAMAEVGIWRPHWGQLADKEGL